VTGMPREEGQRKTQGTNAEGKQASATLGQVQRDAVHVLGVVENEERQARAVACRAQAQGRGHREDAWRQALQSSLKLPAASRQLPNRPPGSRHHGLLPTARFMLTSAAGHVSRHPSRLTSHLSEGDVRVRLCAPTCNAVDVPR